MNKNKNKSLFIFILGLIIGGIFFCSILFLVLNHNMNNMINSKLNNQTDITQDNSSSKESSNISKAGVNTTEKVASTVTPAVVGIETTEVSYDMFTGEYESSGVGTGFIVDSNGYIVTNQHVVTNKPKKISVTLKDGTVYDAKIVYQTTVVDLAIIKIDAKNLPTVKLGDSEKINIGQSAIAIGNPLGMTFERTVTQGIISALNRSIAIDSSTIAEDLIQTDASINAGNSGGPLLNANSEVIGVNTYKIQSGEGLGFAIPINIVKPILEQILDKGEFTPTVLGISGVDKEIARYYTGTEELTVEKGIYIIKVSKGSGAAKAGIKEKDVITKIDGVEINTMLKLREQLYYHKPGDKVKVTLERKGRTKNVEIVLDKASDE